MTVTIGEKNREHQAPLQVSVRQTVNSLQEEFLGRRGEKRRAHARATLAGLRKSAGIEPESAPLALQETLLLLHSALRDEDLGRGDRASASERAVFQALTLFAVHMQSATKEMHNPQVSFASACGMLYRRSSSASMKPRFDAMLSSSSARSRLTHARSLITLLRGMNLAFDYGAFARDLRTLSFPAHRNGVLMRWGRDFASGRLPDGDTDTDNNASSTSKS